MNDEVDLGPQVAGPLRRPPVALDLSDDVLLVFGVGRGVAGDPDALDLLPDLLGPGGFRLGLALDGRLGLDGRRLDLRNRVGRRLGGGGRYSSSAISGGVGSSRIGASSGAAATMLTRTARGICTGRRAALPRKASTAKAP
ncbi:hypothetical protein [Candidatus Palauibacter sp.]|uniref:hypothetical protein n=1 Tax=Candidatus Palauibacter sp. TaxID=3101350 RepID=UPI003AF1F46F